jgi:DNA-binding protein YbaB
MSMGGSDAGEGRDPVALGQRLRELVERCTATARSPDSSVRVSVGAGGMVTGIEVTERALRYGGHTVGRLIVDAAARAAAEVNDLLSAQTPPLVAEGTDLAGLLQGRLPEIPPLDPLPDVAPAEPGGPDHSGDETNADDNDAAAKLRRLREDAERRLATYDSVRSQVSEQLTTVESPDRSVRVTLRGTATLVDISVDDTLVDRDPQDLALTLLATIQSAYAQAAQQLTTLTQQLVGPVLDIAAVVDSARQPGPASDDPTADRGRSG